MNFLQSCVASSLKRVILGSDNVLLRLSTTRYSIYSYQSRKASSRVASRLRGRSKPIRPRQKQAYTSAAWTLKVWGAGPKIPPRAVCRSISNLCSSDNLYMIKHYSRPMDSDRSLRQSPCLWLAIETASPSSVDDYSVLTVF